MLDVLKWLLLAPMCFFIILLLGIFDEDVRDELLSNTERDLYLFLKRLEDKYVTRR